MSWELPSDNGGSSVLGFQLEMKRDAPGTEYIMVYDGQEDPTLKEFSTIIDSESNPLVAEPYFMRVRARNIVGFSAYSDTVTLDLAMKTSHALSVVTGTGVVESFGAVTNSVHVQAVADDGSDRTTGGDVFYLHIE